MIQTLVSPDVISAPRIVSPGEIFKLSRNGEPARQFRLVKVGYQQNVKAVNIALASYGTPATHLWMEAFMEIRVPDKQGPIGFTQSVCADPEQGPVFWYVNSVSGRWHSFRRSLDYACDGCWRFLVEVSQ